MTDSSACAAACARYRVVHETRYAYQSVVTLSQQYLHMTPRSFAYQHIESHETWVSPIENDGVDGLDYFGNKTRQITITAPHQTLLVHAESTVALMQRHDLSRIRGTSSWESLRDRLQQGTDATMLDAYRYLYASPHVNCSTDLEQYARISYTQGRPQLEAALDLTQRIFDEFEFDDTATDISTPLDDVLKGRRGVCQDFAQLMIGCLRSLGLPARYVSGYILTHPPAGQPRLVGADASHAWVSVFCPGLGWVDFDPTNRCIVQRDHITLGWGRDFSDVTPMRGVVLGGGEQELEVRVTVTPLLLNGMEQQSSAEHWQIAMGEGGPQGRTASR
ncbi:transglutaminase family protein [Polaromonas naphthalenivorans]|uniref:Transglutaminase domain protein n=1 Tax=Polaromonas naphthalenivorans (strain CJ2) TaxID=365044 RepID=A1VL52_POLNA|nr:transglutaminase family protein [Polaromonas naphthalenivorans]ABM36380.1 transglutaminase domain protein [Polaromonas naphthalenivorans CJ2]